MAERDTRNNDTVGYVNASCFLFSYTAEDHDGPGVSLFGFSKYLLML